MTKKKYVKDEKGNVRALLTPNVKLQKPLLSDNYDINVHNSNMDKIDTEIQSVKSKIDGLELVASKVTIADVANVFVATNVEEALLENKTSIQQALQSGVDAKNGMVQAINSKVTVPDVSVEDSWSTYIQRVKDIKEGRGNANVADVLSGKTFTNDSGQVQTGTMPNRGGAQTITPGTANKVLNSGYYSGNITVAGDGDLIASNIRKGKNIFGINGALVEGSPVSKGVINLLSSNLWTISGFDFIAKGIVMYGLYMGSHTTLCWFQDMGSVGYMLSTVETSYSKFTVDTSIIGRIDLKLGTYRNSWSNVKYLIIG